jgi:hypothetical protein
MTVTEYLTASGLNLHQLSQRSGVSYNTLHRHVRHGRRMKQETAEKLSKVDPLLSVVDILGLRSGSVPPRSNPAAA